MNNFSNISTTLAKDLIVSQSLSQSPLIPRAHDPILTTQSPSRTSCRVQSVTL